MHVCRTVRYSYSQPSAVSDHTPVVRTLAATLARERNLKWRRASCLVLYASVIQASLRMVKSTGWSDHRQWQQESGSTSNDTSTDWWKLSQHRVSSDLSTGAGGKRRAGKCNYQPSLGKFRFIVWKSIKRSDSVDQRYFGFSASKLSTGIGNRELPINQSWVHSLLLHSTASEN